MKARADGTNSWPTEAVKSSLFYCRTAVLALLVVSFLSTCASAGVVFNTVQFVYNPPGNRYSYGPSVVKVGNTEHIFVCQNEVSGVVKDSIYYHQRVNGSIVQSTKVLSAGASGAWDSFHVCDPSILQGSFVMFGVTYSYALFYTGNDRDASQNNQVGVAFANNLAGPWTKYPYPLIFNTTGTSSWGVGQPSVTSVNGSGDVLIFYTEGGATLTRGMVAHLDIHNMAGIITYFYQAVTNAGLTNQNGNPDYLNNFDIVYDPSRDRFYVVREQHPYPSNFPTWITSSVQVASIPGGNIWAGNGTWVPEGAVSTGLTGFPRNHNAGIKRSFYGTLPSASNLDVMFTNSCDDSGGGCNSFPAVLWTYDLYEALGTL